METLLHHHIRSKDYITELAGLVYLMTGYHTINPRDSPNNNVERYIMIIHVT